MRLADYLAREKLTLEAFGQRIGCTHTHVSRLLSGKRKPSWEMVDRIFRATNGEVTAVDFADQRGVSRADSRAA